MTRPKMPPPPLQLFLMKRLPCELETSYRFALQVKWSSEEIPIISVLLLLRQLSSGSAAAEAAFYLIKGHRSLLLLLLHDADQLMYPSNICGGDAQLRSTSHTGGIHSTEKFGLFGTNWLLICRPHVLRRSCASNNNRRCCVIFRRNATRIRVFTPN